MHDDCKTRLAASTGDLADFPKIPEFRSPALRRTDVHPSPLGAATPQPGRRATPLLQNLPFNCSTLQTWPSEQLPLKPVPLHLAFHAMHTSAAHPSAPTGPCNLTFQCRQASALQEPGIPWMLVTREHRPLV